MYNESELLEKGPVSLLTFVCRRIVGHLDECGHRDLVHFVRIWRRVYGTSAPPAVSNLTVTALDTLATVQAYVHCAAELHVRRFRELEGAKFGRQKVTVNCVEIIEQIRIHRTTGLQMRISQM